MLGDIYSDVESAKDLLDRVPELQGTPPEAAAEILNNDYSLYKARSAPYNDRFGKDDTPLRWWRRMVSESPTVSVIGVSI